MLAVEDAHSAVGEVHHEEGDAEKKDFVQGGVHNTTITVHPLFQKSYEVKVAKGKGGHGRGDPVLLRHVLVGGSDDQFKHAAYIRDGGNAVLVGVGANHYMKSGMPINVQDLVIW